MSELVGGRYKIISPLGAGGMAEVFLAEHKGPKGFARRTVIKRLHRHLANNEEFVASFGDEARLAARLEHPNIVRTEDFGEHEGQLFLVLEFIEGETLYSLLISHLKGGDEPMPLNLVLQIGVDIADALDHAHKLYDDDGTPLAVVHRDVSPQNIMVTPAGQAKLLDFGVARAATNQVHTEGGMLKGKASYFSPEQACGEYLDGSSDQFALAVILYEALSGRRLFRDKDLISTLKRVARCQVPNLRQYRPDVPEEVAEVLERALSQLRAARFEDCSAFAEALNQCLEVAGGRWDARKYSGWRATLPAADSNTSSSESSASNLSSPSAKSETTGLDGIKLEISQEIDAFIDEFGSRSSPTESEPPTNLGDPADRFFGRQTELSELATRVEEGQRLITLLGAGGTGKTRLSQKFGITQRSLFPGGVWFCDLCDARSKEGVIGTLAAVLDVPLTDEDSSMQLANAVAARGRALFILDNFEQVVGHAADTLGRWLKQAPDAVLLVTSRILLRITGEEVMHLSPLPLPDAMQLFYDRACAVQPNFTATTANQPVVMEIAERLDRMALAIELAAARVRVLSPEKIRERLGERFKLLRGQRRDQSDRQATLRGAIDWSWDLLQDHERTAFAQLSVFHGGFTLKAAEAVVVLDGFDDAPWVMDLVETLFDHSLLMRYEPHPGQVRYRMQESVRAYAEERLGQDSGAVVRRHAEFFSSFGKEAFLGQLMTHGATACLQALVLEIENLMVGIEAALADGDAEAATGCGLAAIEVLALQGPFSEVARLCELLLAQPISDAARMRLLSKRSWQLYVTGNWQAAYTVQQETLALAVELGDRKTEAQELCFQANIIRHFGEFEQATELYNQGLAISRASDDQHAIGRTLSRIGNLFQDQGQWGRAEPYQLEAIKIMRQLGDRRYEGNILGNVAVGYMELGRLAECRQCYEDALLIHRECNNPRVEAMAMSNLATFHHNYGELDTALELYQTALASHRRMGERRWECITCGNLGDLLFARGQAAAAENYFLRAIGLGDQLMPGAAGAFRGSLAMLRKAQGNTKEAFTLIIKAERQLRGLNLLELGKVLCKKAQLEHETGTTAIAKKSLNEAESIAIKLALKNDSELRRLIAATSALLATDIAP